MSLFPKFSVELLKLELQFLVCHIFINLGPVVQTNNIVSNVSLKFQTLISQICQYFLFRKCEKLLSFFQQKMSRYLVIKLMS